MTIDMDENGVELASPIQKFYSGQNIFITGGTGFLGKVLIEKLLRSCTDLGSIYLLVRPKKGEDVEQRAKKMFADVLFDRMKKEVPKYRHKIVAVAGDCRLPGLGLSREDAETLKAEVSIVFNVAATVRFDEKLKEAIAINVRGPKEVIELCKSMKNLKAVTHVSTAYSNCNRRDIDEKLYEPPITGDNAIELANSLDDEEAEALTGSLLGEFPNTYTFTKCIAEQVVCQHGKDMPIGIFRPAVVVSTYNEPLEGWIDNVYGPTGSMCGAAAGLIRVAYMDDNCKAELIPADYTVNALIAVAYDVGCNKREQDEPPIYNYHASWDGQGITWGRYTKLGLEIGKSMPTARSIWYYTVNSTSSLRLFTVLALFYHTIPAIFMDAGLFVAGKKTRLLRAYKKIHKFLVMTGYFATREWKFSNRNSRRLWESLSTTDRKLFPFSMKDFDWDDFMYKCLVGLRMYIFKEDASMIPYARKRMYRFLVLHQIVKYGSLLLMAWLSYRTTYFFLNIGSVGLSSIREKLIER